DVEVGRSPGCGLDVAMGHAHAPALVNRGLGLDDAFLILAVVVGVELEARGLGRREQGVVERILVGHRRDLERPCRAAPLAAGAAGRGGGGCRPPARRSARRGGGAGRARRPPAPGPPPGPGGWWAGGRPPPTPGRLEARGPPPPSPGPTETGGWPFPGREPD